MITILYLLTVLFFILSASYKLKYLKRMQKVKDKKVSLIIPARNEEDNIEEIINSALAQNYKKENYEIIIVNDRSEDKTQEIIEKYEEKSENLKLINIKNKSDLLSGKQNALDIGIKKAKGEIILITDADCILNKNWIKTIIRCFYSENIGLVVGKTEITEEKRKNILYKIQVMVHTILLEFAQVPIMFGFYTSGMGNNLAFLRSGYFKIGGFEGLGDSILDDEILVRGFARSGYKIAAAFTKNATIQTKPMKTWKNMLKQHKRWIVGSLNIFTPSGLLALLFYFVNLYSIVLIFTNTYLFLFKLLGDYLLINYLDKKGKNILNIFDKILLSFLATFYLFFVETLALVNPRTKWKNEKYKLKRKQGEM